MTLRLMTTFTLSTNTRRRTVKS